jgi:uncharacterized protein YegP (UPF0339 family)
MSTKAKPKPRRKRDPRVKFYWTEAAQYRWRLRAPNGETIGSGEGFSSMAKARSSFALVAKYAPLAVEAK